MKGRARFFVGASIPCLLLCASTRSYGQTDAVNWNAFSPGFGVVQTGNTLITTGVGQTFTGLSRQGDLMVDPGFLADPLFGSPVTDVEPDALRPTQYALSQNYPNPFNPTTKIQFTIVDRQLTIVKVYDVLGRDVKTLVNEVKPPGSYTVQFDGSGLSSGLYFYRLQAGDFVQTKKMLVVK
jgi:hypothetical protein